MYIICLIVLFMVLYKITLDKDQSYYFSKNYTQSWKGILCIGVLMTHILEIYNWPNFLYNLHSFGYIEVAIFFMFSGYGLKYSLNNKENYMQSFWKKRFLKIYLPYLICGLLCYFLKNIWIMNEDLSAIGVLKRITGYDAIWFIKALLIFYIAFWFIYKFFSKKGNLLMGIFIIGYILICFSLKVDKTWYGSVIPFYIGIILADNIEKIKKAKVNILFLSICGVLACGMEVLYIIFKDDVLFGSLIIRNLLCLSITIFFLMVTQKIRVGNKFAMFFGEISYEVFLIHPTCIAIVKSLTNNRISIEIQAFLIFLLVVVMAYVMNKIDSVVVKRACK